MSVLKLYIKDVLGSEHSELNNEGIVDIKLF